MKRYLPWVIVSVLVVAVAAVLAVTGQASAQSSTPTDDEVNAIAHQLYCPVCENVPLDVCPTQSCEQWRGLIREQLSQGWTELQIKNYFVEQYGQRVLAEPPKKGLNWLAYLLPPLIILTGVYVLFRVFKNWHVSPQEVNISSTTEPDGEGDEYVRRLEEELKKRE